MSHKSFGIANHMAKVLIFLHQHDGATCEVISKALCIDQALIHGIVCVLSDEGYILTQRSTGEFVCAPCGLTSPLHLSLNGLAFVEKRSRHFIQWVLPFIISVIALLVSVVSLLSTI